MPLRYFQMPESNYVPRHVPVSEQLLDRTHTLIDQQGRESFARMDAYDEFGSNVVANLSGLTDSQRQEVTNMLSEGRAGMEEYVDTHGAREAHRIIGRTAREFQEGVRPYQQRSEQIMQIQERIQESEADPNSKNFVLNKIMSANEETPINEQLRQSQHLATLDNWVDYDKYFGDLTKLIKDPTNEGMLGSSDDPNVQLWARTTGRSMSDVMAVLTGQARQNPQIIAQLQLEIEQMAEAGVLGEEYFDDQGNVDFNKKVTTDFSVRDEDGNIIGEETTADMSIIDRLVAEKAKAIAFARTNYGVQFDKSQFLGGKDDMVGSNLITTSVGGQAPYKDVSEMYRKTNEQIQDINNRLVAHGKDIKTFARQSGVEIDEITTDDSGHNLLFKSGRETYTEEQLRNRFADDPLTQSALDNLIGLKRQSNNQLSEIKQDRQDFEDHIRTKIANEDNLSQFADYIDFDPATGQIQFKEGFSSLDLSGVDLRRGELDRSTRRNRRNREILDSIPEGQAHLNVELYTSGTGTRYAPYPQRYDLLKLDDKIYNLNKISEIEAVRDAAQEYQRRHFEHAIKPKEFIMMYFDPDVHKTVLQQVENEIIDFEGQAIDSNGNAVTIEDTERIAIKGMAPMGGEAYIVGNVIDRETGRPTQRNVRIQADVAQSIADNMFGDEFAAMITQQEFYKFIPTPSISGQRTKSLTSNDMRMFHIHEKYKDKLNITTRTYHSMGDVRHVFRVQTEHGERTYSRFTDILPDLIEGTI